MFVASPLTLVPFSHPSSSGAAAERELALQRARDATAEVDAKASDLLAWLQQQEDYLKGCGSVADTYDNLVMQLEEHKVCKSSLQHKLSPLSCI